MNKLVLNSQNYNSFIKKNYSKNDNFIFSTDVNKTSMYIKMTERIICVRKILNKKPIT